MRRAFRHNHSNIGKVMIKRYILTGWYLNSGFSIEIPHGSEVGIPYCQLSRLCTKTATTPPTDNISPTNRHGTPIFLQLRYKYNAATASPNHHPISVPGTVSHNNGCSRKRDGESKIGLIFQTKNMISRAFTKGSRKGRSCISDRFHFHCMAAYPANPETASTTQSILIIKGPNCKMSGNVSPSTLFLSMSSVSKPYGNSFLNLASIDCGSTSPIT